MEWDGEWLYCYGGEEVRSKGLLIVTTSFPDVGDGSEAAGAFISDLADELQERLPVHVVAPGHLSTRDARGGVRVHRFASPGRPLSLLSPTRPTDWPAITRVLLAMRAQTLQVCASADIAHILAAWVLPSGWAARVARQHYGVPYSVWALGSDIWTLGRVTPLRPVLRSVLRGATRRYADGLALASDARRIGGVDVDFLPSTRRPLLGMSRRVSPLPPYRLLFLGRWHPNKGVDILLDALRQLPDAVWARIASVDIAGGGPLAHDVHAGVAALAASGRPVTVDGYLDTAQAAAAIDRADWLLIPSRIESIPVVFSDAMKAGRPVVSMPVGDLPGLVSGRVASGVLAADVSSAAFAAAVAEAVFSPTGAFAAGIRDVAQRFDLRAIADEVARVALQGRAP